MASNYDYLGATATEEIIGGGQTRPMRLVSARSQPSGVGFTILVGLADFNPNNLGIILGTIADALEKCSDVKGVTDINVYQDVNAAGQFVSKVAVGVESSSGDSSETIMVPYGAIFDDRFAADVKKAVGNLDALEGL